ncbi:MAG: DUF4037 domain-containing protein [Anaerolineae bacterium]|nr:DUF4037 domain-containing protein [Anaerolineae bacterium]
MTDTTLHLELARRLADAYAVLPEVRAVAVAGSVAAGAADAGSDLDLYVYYSAPIPLDARAAIAAGSPQAEIGNDFFGFGDEWIDAASGLHVDVVLWHDEWMADQIARTLDRHEAWMGYTTCFWYTVRQSRLLYDRDGWFAALQAKAAGSYPEPLRQAIIAKNQTFLRDTLSSYRYQLAGAVRRGDMVAVNHRVAAALASYFDVLFALNRLPHPGEKRLVQIASTVCKRLPPDWPDAVCALLAAAGQEGEAVVARLDALVDGLEVLLQAEGLA